MNANELLKLIRATVALTPELNQQVADYLAVADSVQIIVAGSQRQAQSIALQKGVKRYTHITTPEGLNGLPRGQAVWLVGTYYNLQGWGGRSRLCVRRTSIGLSRCAMTDYELEKAALLACGYRVHEKERNGTRWLTACKGLQVRYEHWHPLSNIHQAMQLLQDGDLRVELFYYGAKVRGDRFAGVWVEVESEPSPQALITSFCRAVVNACASLKAVP